MSNLRIIYDNAADRATLTSSATQGSLGVSNLLSDIKSKVCRSTGTTLSVYAAWSSVENISAVAIPFTNLSPTATARIRLTNETSATNLLTNSEGAVATLGPNSGVTDASAFPSTGLARSLKFVRGASNVYAYRTFSTVVGTTYSFSFFVIMDDSGAPVPGPNTSASADMTIFVQSDAQSGAGQITALNGGVYRISYTFTATTTGTNYGIAKYTTQSNRGFRVTGYQLEVGSTATSYFPTTASAGVRPTGYIDTWQTYSYDNGAVVCCPSPYRTMHGFTQTQASSAYAYGGGKYACVWLPAKMTATGIAIDIVDTNNLQGYVEISRLVCGDYWSPSVVDVSNTTMQVVDTSSHTRTAAGDLYTYVGTRHRKQAINLPSIEAASRKQLWDIMFGNGMSNPLFISTYAGNADPGLEAAHMLYGKLSQTPVMSTPYFNYNAATIEIEEV